MGLSRLVVTLLARTGMAADRAVPSAVLVAVTDEASRPESDAIATALRAHLAGPAPTAVATQSAPADAPVTATAAATTAARDGAC